MFAYKVDIFYFNDVAEVENSFPLDKIVIRISPSLADVVNVDVKRYHIMFKISLNEVNNMI